MASTGTLASALEAELARLGYRVTGPAGTGPGWQAVMDSVGGFYDTSTGDLDAAKADGARRAFATRVARDFGAEAVLRRRLELAEAE